MAGWRASENNAIIQSSSFGGRRAWKWRGLTCGALALMLNACGSGKSDEGEVALPEGAHAGQNAVTAATSDVPETPPKPDCAALPKSQAPSEATVLGLTFGMGVDEVKQRLSCANPGFEFKLSEREQSPDAAAPKMVIRKLQARSTLESPGLPATDEVTVLFADIAGATKLIKIDRSTWFDKKHLPFYSVYRKEIETKYPGMIFDEPNRSRLEGRLAKSQDGQVLNEENRLFSACISTGGWHLNFKVNPNCGLAAGISVTRERDGSDVIEAMVTTLMDHGYAAKVLTESHNANAPIFEAERKEAIEAAPKPQL